ncbi:Hsp20/alpha crystallin family protein [bacterium]|nr:Hsp20/alpha crystallin family protein [bacterium]
MKDHKRFDKAIERDFQRDRMLEVEGNRIFHIVQTKDNYKIIVDLNAFDNDERNIETKIDGNTLTITGAGMKETSNTTKIAKFSQSYAFGNDVDLKDMTKMRHGNQYIITIPIED